MLSQLFQSFTQAPQGQQAMQQLARQGVAPNQAMGYLSSAFPAAASAFHRAMATGGGPQGITDFSQSHYVTNFLSGAVSGLLRGEGLMGAAVDGVQGVVGGHVAQVIATRFGLPQRVAGTIGAIVTPLIIDFLWERVRGGLDLGSLLGAGGSLLGAGGLAAGGAALGAAAMSQFGGGQPRAGQAAPAQTAAPAPVAQQPTAAPTMQNAFGDAPAATPAASGGASLNDPFGVLGAALPGGVPALGAIASAAVGGGAAGQVLGGLGSLLDSASGSSSAGARPATGPAAGGGAGDLAAGIGSIFQMFGGQS